jgi:hypothetical protein
MFLKTSMAAIPKTRDWSKPKVPAKHAPGWVFPGHRSGRSKAIFRQARLGVRPQIFLARGARHDMVLLATEFLVSAGIPACNQFKQAPWQLKSAGVMPALCCFHRRSTGAANRPGVRRHPTGFPWLNLSLWN